MNKKLISLLGPAIIISMTFADPPKTGEPAPDFTTTDSNGTTVTLSEAIQRGPVVLYFYPKDDTPGCTKQACNFRDDFAKFQALGAQIYGVSNDTLDSHKAFIAKYNLPFPLLLDTNKKISAAYGAGSSGFPKRITFIIGRDGKIAYANLDVNKNLAGHSAEILAELENLK